MLKRRAPPITITIAVEERNRVRKNWLRLKNAFRNGQIEFDFRLAHIQTVYSSFGIELNI